LKSIRIPAYIDGLKQFKMQVLLILRTNTGSKSPICPVSSTASTALDTARVTPEVKAAAPIK